jgi:hypothetical protein
LYRNQPSRENSYAPTLNDFMNKYVTSDTNYNFIRTLENLKFFNKHWRKIPKQTQLEIMKTLKDSNSSLASDLRNKHKHKHPMIESFTDPNPSGDSSTDIVKIIVTFIVAATIGYIIGTIQVQVRA